MSVKLVFVYMSPTRHWESFLSKLFTGSDCYHVGWLDTESDHFYDMFLIRRRRIYTGLYHPSDVYMVDQSYVNVSYLERQLDSDENTYGFIDYLLFSVRGLFHLFGRSTPNAKGVICSEMISNDLTANGWKNFYKEVPSPADLEETFLGKRDYIHSLN